MKKLNIKLLLIAAILTIGYTAATAAVTGNGSPIVLYNSPSTQADVTAVVGCQDGSFVYNTDTWFLYAQTNCSGTPNYLQLFPSSAGTRTINLSSRALNSCFQISNTKDADFHYSVDVTAGLSLLGSSTATVTSYTNSGCTTGAQGLRDGSIGGVAIGATSTIQIDGSVQANKWLKITTSNGLGTTSAIRAVQQEVIQP